MNDKKIDYAERARKTRETKIKKAGGEKKYLEKQRASGQKGGLSASEEANRRKGMASATKEQRIEWGSRGGKKSKRNRTLAQTEIDYIM